MTVPTGQEHAAQALRAELQERGIQVELRLEQTPSTRRRNAAAGDAADAVQVEDMDPLRIFRLYMNQLSSHPELLAILASSTTGNNASSSLAPDEHLDLKVLEEGLHTLQRLQDSTKTIGGASGHEKLLRFDSVALSNFGPYCGEKVVIYPLSNRGLVLIKGQSTDGTGADSNGAGKVKLK